MLSRYVFMILLLIAVGVAFYPEREAPTPTALPEFQFMIGEETKSLSDYKGTLTLVHFWATWCPPCLPEMPELVALAQANPNITILAFSADRTRTEMERYFSNQFKKLSANFIPVWDENATIAREEFYSFNYPETYIIGCAGAIDEKIIGAGRDWQRTLTPHLENCSK